MQYKTAYFHFNIVPCCPRNHYSKNQKNWMIISYKKLLSKKLKPACFKWTYGLSSNDYRDATLSKSYITVTVIIMQSLKSLEQF